MMSGRLNSTAGNAKPQAKRGTTRAASAGRGGQVLMAAEVNMNPWNQILAILLGAALLVIAVMLWYARLVFIA